MDISCFMDDESVAALCGQIWNKALHGVHDERKYQLAAEFDPNGPLVVVDAR